MKAIILLEHTDGLLYDMDGSISATATGLGDKIALVLPLLKAFREGKPLPPKFLLLRELLASFDDEPLYVRQAGEIVCRAASGAPDDVIRKPLMVDIPTQRLISLVLAMRALDSHWNVGDVGGD